MLSLMWHLKQYICREFGVLQKTPVAECCQRVVATAFTPLREYRKIDSYSWNEEQERSKARLCLNIRLGTKLSANIFG